MLYSITELLIIGVKIVGIGLMFFGICFLIVEALYKLEVLTDDRKVISEMVFLRVSNDVVSYIQKATGNKLDAEVSQNVAKVIQSSLAKHIREELFVNDNSVGKGRVD